MHGSDFAIPRQVDVPLHVGVERERLAGEIVGVVVRVAEAAELQRVRRAVVFDPEQRAPGSHAAGGVPARIHVAVEKLRLLVALQRGVSRDAVGGHEGMVAHQDGNGPVRSTTDVVGAVLADPARVSHEDFPRVRDTIAVSVRQAEEVGFAILRVCAVGVERGAVEPNALAVLDLIADDLLRLERAVTIVVQQAHWMAALLGNDRQSLGIERDLDQGAYLGVVGQRLHHKSGRDLVRPLQNRLGHLATPDGYDE